MLKRNWFIFLLAVAGVWTIGEVSPVMGQALLPYTLNLDADQLEQDGLNLAQDAAQLVRFGQLELAFPRAKLATQLAPDAYETWFILGSLHVQREEVDEGIAVLEKAYSLAPSEPGISFSLGSAYFQKGKYENAIAQLETGLALKPDSIEALFDLGNAYLVLKRFPDAIASYEQSLELRSDFWPAINNIGLVKYEQGDIEGAIAKWETAAEIDKEAAEPLLAIAVALYKSGRQQQGIRMGESALQMDNRYGDIDFLEENLWGETLLGDAQAFFAVPQIQSYLVSQETSEHKH